MGTHIGNRCNSTENECIHFSYGIDDTGDMPSQTKMDKGEYKHAHFSFGLEDDMDRIMVTKHGETPPKLGHSLHEGPESIKNRKKKTWGDPLEP
jgi:hypothetical protein